MSVEYPEADRHTGSEPLSIRIRKDERKWWDEHADILGDSIRGVIAQAMREHRKAVEARIASVGTPEYVRDYQQGWRTSEAASYTESVSESALERADRLGFSDAWYDGYHDYAAGRAAFHMLHCLDHDYCQRGE